MLLRECNGDETRPVLVTCSQEDDRQTILHVGIGFERDNPCRRQFMRSHEHRAQHRKCQVVKQLQKFSFRLRKTQDIECLAKSKELRVCDCVCFVRCKPFHHSREELFEKAFHGCYTSDKSFSKSTYSYELLCFPSLGNIDRRQENRCWTLGQTTFLCLPDNFWSKTTSVAAAFVV